MSEARSPEEVRAEIAETRAEMQETATELAAKTDVKAQARRVATEKKDQVKQATAETVARVANTAAEAGDRARHQFTDGDPATVARRPLPLTAIAAAALGIAGIVIAVLRRRRR
jgi:hypothetical protein